MKDFEAHITRALPRFHTLVLGPGLGNWDTIQESAAEIIKAARKANKQ